MQRAVEADALKAVQENIKTVAQHEQEMLSADFAGSMRFVVLIKQDRMSRVADNRRHLNLQIDLLAEREVTKMLQIQRLICRRLGIEEAVEDRDAQELSTKRLRAHVVLLPGDECNESTKLDS